MRHVSITGGHLASNLGVVELTIAIHRIFDFPKDHLIFDVGHQSYVHKILTGRMDRFDTLRQSGGLSGFTKREESVYDCFGAGHSSTSLSAAIGFAEADRLKGSNSTTVAVVGDGAFTGGMIHEALNNLRPDQHIVIILNENEMSISKNIGRFAAHLARIRTRTGYYKAKNAAGRTLKRIPLIGKKLFGAVRRVKKFIKNALYGSNFFEDIGIYYLGPVDGHNLENLQSVLSEARDFPGISLVHVKTKKGKGYPAAEQNPNAFHGIAPASKVRNGPNYSMIAGDELTILGRTDQRICAITAAMCEGTGLSGFKAEFPKRYYDVGIAEEHAVTFAAAMSAAGLKPVFAVYSTFLQRGFDQLIHDCALQKLPVTLLIDRAGLSAGDGPTHHGIFDVSMLLGLPGTCLSAPVSRATLRMAIEAALSDECTCIIRAVRYPNDVENEAVLDHFGMNENPSLGTHMDFALSDRPDIILITYGRIVKEAIRAKEILSETGIDLGLCLMEKLDVEDPVFQTFEELGKKVLVLEEGVLGGGFGEQIAQVYNSLDVRVMAITDPFVTAAEGQSIWDSAGLSAPHIVKKCKDMVHTDKTHPTMG